MELMAPIIPFLAPISAGFSVLQGVAGLQAGRQSAAYAEADAEQAKLTAAAEATRQRRITAAQLGEYRAQVGAQGTTFEGSPMLAYLENVKEGEMQALDKLYAGQLKSRSLKEEANIYRRRGTLDLLGGVAQGAGTLGSTLLRA
jgi:hypothetical protein